MLHPAGSRPSKTPSDESKQAAGSQSAQVCGLAVTPRFAYRTARDQPKCAEPYAADDSSDDRTLSHVTARFRDGPNVHDRDLLLALTLAQAH